MAGANSSESPLDTVAETVDDQTTNAFELLGNDTRLAILLALWDAKDPGPTPAEPTQPGVSFSDLRDRVGVRDSGQFNYHLEKLTGAFIEQTETGYTLTPPAEQILSAVFAGTLTDPPSFEGEPTDSECYRCGAPTVIDYSDGILITRCTRCEGGYHHPDDPPGVLGKGYRPPVGLANRTPQEFARHGRIRVNLQGQSMMQGVCADCSGTVSSTVHVCDEHDTHDGTVCERCGSAFEILSLFVCDVCKAEVWAPVWWAPIFTEMAVTAFFRDHGVDPDTRFVEGGATRVLQDTIERLEVTATDPLQIGMTVELDGDRLSVTLDDEAQVIDVTEE